MIRGITFVLAAVLALGVSPSAAEEPDAIRLIVRGDDIGFSHAANLACIESYQGGVVRTVEVMVPGPWFPEAVQLLRENPGLDVGVHLVLTSEWEGLKWRPLTHAPSLVDDWGYFFPMIWPNENFTREQAFREAPWKLEEVEAEMRAQIELAVVHIPQVSHLSAHMGWTAAAPELQELFSKLAAEYDLAIDPRAHGARRMDGFGAAPASAEEKVRRFTAAVAKLEPGLWIFVDHPGHDTPELRGVGHEGYEDVAQDREGVTAALTDAGVLEAVERAGIRLLSYADLRRIGCSEK